MRIVQFVKAHKIVASVVFVDLILIIALIVIFLIKVKKTATVDILVTPTIATIDINGEKYGAAGAYRLFPGEVKVTISADGFESKEMTIELKSGETTKIYEYLEPLAESANYYAKNLDDAKLLSTVGGEDGLKLLHIISIRNILPIIDYQYGGLYEDSKEIVIDQDVDCRAVFCLVVVGDTSGGHDMTQKLLKEKGYNPSDYKIRYEDE